MAKGAMGMKSLGIVTALSVGVTALAPSAQSHAPDGLNTSRSVQSFTDCFTAAQDRQEAAWAFAPSKHGGTFSNLGAAGVAKPYFIVISDRGNRRAIILENVKAGTPAAMGVSQCA